MIQTPATTVRPQRADARRNRERIVAAARAAFAEQGIEAQMDDIAGRAGVGVGTVYRHFPTKDALVGALAAQHFEAIAELGESALSGPGAPGVRLEAFLWESARRMGADAALAEIMAERPQAMGDAASEQARLGAAVDALVAAGVASGELRPDATGADIPTIMCGLGSVMAKRELGFVGGWERYLTIVLDGLRARRA
jgi:AcrR family transcriptional regulator